MTEQLHFSFFFQSTSREGNTDSSSLGTDRQTLAVGIRLVCAYELWGRMQMEADMSVSPLSSLPTHLHPS